MRVLYLRMLFAALLFAIWARAIAAAPPPDLSTIKPRPGFQVELMAAEPLIVSPVAFDWGTDGRLWVVEMRDYPLGMNNQGEPGGRVVYLEDTDGDGRFDKSTLFLDKLLFPTGVMSWGKGVLVTCAPDILYAEASTGIGKADKIEKIFSGFGEANPQHRVNGLRWGLDNWIYCANGDFASVRKLGAVEPPEQAGHGFSASQAEDLRRLRFAGAHVKSNRTRKVYDIRNRDLRFRPDEGLLDPQSGQAQFGRDCDDWGNWFGCDHSMPAWHYALDDTWLRRNPHVAAPSARVEMPRSVTYALGTGRTTGTRRLSGGNAWTSACSVMVYRDTLFGPEFAENWFTCEPVHNLIHREVLQPNGVTFRSRRATDEQSSEFLASTDSRFTPVSIRTGPDGAMWVADMHREVLEHPHWLPAGWEKKVDVRAGHQQGRLYRVYPTAQVPRSWPRLDRLDAAGLVSLLDSPNGWLRDKAQQLLVQRRDKSVVSTLEALATSGTSPQSRMHALCTLDGLQTLRPELLAKGLQDEHPGVRQQAVRLSALESVRTAEVEQALLKRVDDPSLPVRLQLAYVLGDCESPAASQALARLLVTVRENYYLTAGALSSLNRRNLDLVTKAVLDAEKDVPATVTLGLLQSAVGFGESQAAATLLERLVASTGAASSRPPFTLLADWLDSLDQRNTPLPKLAGDADERLRKALNRLAIVFAAARQTAADESLPLPQRVEAFRLLGRGLDHREEDQKFLAGLLGLQNGDELQTAAVTALAQAGDSERLVEEWKGFTPKLRLRVVEGLLSRPDSLRALLDALAAKRIVPQEIPLTARQRLLEHPQRDVRERAGKLFTDQVDPNRHKVVVAYEAALQLKGDPGRGLKVFHKTCAVCHRVSVVGQQVGPDIAMARDKPPEWFLPALLDPSRAVEAQFLGYTAITREGKTFAGILSEESGNSITLLGPSGERHVLLRSNLEELNSTGKSLMPEGLERELTPQAVADLIAWLKSPLRLKVEHNAPELVRSGPAGTFNLLPGNGELFGDTVRVVEDGKVLYTGPNDRAVWTFELPRRGRYAVWLKAMPLDDETTSECTLEVSGQIISHHPISAASRMRMFQAGTVTLDIGINRLTFEITTSKDGKNSLVKLYRIILKFEPELPGEQRGQP